MLTTYNAITKDKYETYTSAVQLYQMCTQHISKDDYLTESLHLKSTTLEQHKTRLDNWPTDSFLQECGSRDSSQSPL